MATKNEHASTQGVPNFDGKNRDKLLWWLVLFIEKEREIYDEEKGKWIPISASKKFLGKPPAAHGTTEWKTRQTFHKPAADEPLPADARSAIVLAPRAHQAREIAMAFYGVGPDQIELQEIPEQKLPDRVVFIYRNEQREIEHRATPLDQNVPYKLTARAMKQPAKKAAAKRAK